MTKSIKYVILAAGLLGLISFFMPLISVSKAGITGKLSAYRIVKGLDSAQEVVGKEGAKLKDKDDRAAVADANKALGAVKGIVMAVYFPAFMLFLFGLVGSLKRSFGRGLSIPSFIFGLLGLGIAGLLSAAASSGGGESVAGVGMHLLLASAILGTAAGLVGIVKPDRRLAPQPAAPRFAAQGA
ncbi:MAG: hypothetical protein RBU30_06800 [Polyangia bacterium]|jgi:hypothetical protein|nr:hypothetical protein [Polyangia bacterium]